MTRLLVCMLSLLPALALAQPTAPNCDAPNAICRARRFSLLAGNALCLNSTACTTTLKADSTTKGVVVTAGIANSGTNTALVVNTSGAISGSTQLASFQNNGTEKFAVQDDGYANALGWGNPAASPATAGLTFTSNDAILRSGTSTLYFQVNAGSTADMRLSATGLSLALIDSQKITFAATDSSGTPGNATVNKPSGQAAIDAAAAAVTISNTTVTATSIVHAVLQATDATCTSIKSVVPGANTFTINANAACTGATKVGWTVFN